MTRVSALILAGLALVPAGCLVEIDKVQDPAPYFAKAREEARAVQGRPGPAREVKVVVYDPGEKELVRVSLPMWIVRKMNDGAVVAENDAEDRAERAVRRHLTLKDLDHAGLGVLAEVEEEGGDQVFVWLQ